LGAILGIWSDLDIALLESQMIQSTEYTTDFTYKKIEGAGHWMMLDNPNELNSLMLDFLKK
jgi:pimeloyl-ACP methyl ester carboxylesterase